MKTAAIYARVSSDKQREENTIASQTAALVAFAREQQFEVPQEWVFEDDGYSGATLIRPGLERVRDLAAEGLIQAVLVYAPDRLSRRYAHQILLIEELARAGVETLFVRAPRGSTPENELLLQFQGMIAEYERAQILERSRRGKRHRARQGEVSVLSSAPFGYRFIRKTDHSAAYYEVDEEQARVVRRMFELYSVEGLSIGAIARLLNEHSIPTCKRRGRWERSTVWGMLRNPAYKGQACFGKTTLAPRQRITRPIRLRGGIAPRNSASHERPREDWITISVPPIVSEETFAQAQERLEANKTHAPRRTLTPSVVQGLVSCAKCGYALYRTSTRSSARVIHYYRCLGSDAWRRLSGYVCNNRPVRQDLLDEVVWTEIVRLLEDPQLIQNELDRRLAAAREADPTKRREEAVRRDLIRIRKSIDRLLTAYQEGLLIFSQYRTTAEWVLEALCATYPNEPVALYAGGTASFVQRGTDRRSATREQIKASIQRGDVRLVCATDAACEGLNLQRLGAQVNVDLPWNPSRLQQRKGRVQRIGQVRDDVHILNLRYAGTVEDDVYATLSDRFGDIFSVLGQLPDGFEDQWINAVLRDRQAVKNFSQRVEKARPPMELRYMRDVADDRGLDWEYTERVLSSRDLDEWMRQGW